MNKEPEITIDFAPYLNDLTNAGFTNPQAMAIVQVLRSLVKDHLATRKELNHSSLVLAGHIGEVAKEITKGVKQYATTLNESVRGALGG